MHTLRLGGVVASADNAFIAEVFKLVHCALCIIGEVLGAAVVMVSI